MDTRTIAAKDIAVELSEMLAAHRDGMDGSDCSDINDRGSCLRCERLDRAIKFLSSLPGPSSSGWEPLLRNLESAAWSRSWKALKQARVAIKDASGIELHGGFQDALGCACGHAPGMHQDTLSHRGCRLCACERTDFTFAASAAGPAGARDERGTRTTKDDE